MEKGYIKLWRSFFDHPLWKEERVYSRAEAWLWMLKEANFLDVRKKLIKGHVVQLQYGELVGSRRYLEEIFGWSNSKVDKFLKILCEENMIITRHENASGITIITICKYSTYNSEAEEETPPKRQESATETPARRQQGANSNELNNLKEVKELNERGAAPPAPEKKSEKKGERKKALTTRREQFQPPDQQTARDYFTGVTRKYWTGDRAQMEADLFLNHYTANGWIQNGDKPIVDWKAAANGWMLRALGGSFTIQKGQATLKSAQEPVLSLPEQTETLYQAFLKKGNLTGQKTPQPIYEHLKSCGCLKMTTAEKTVLRDSATRHRIEQLTGSNKTDDLYLLEAYQGATGIIPASKLTDDEPNLHRIMRRMAIMYYFEKCKAKQLKKLSDEILSQTPAATQGAEKN